MDLRKVKKLIELVEESGIAELEVTSGDESVRIAMPGARALPVAPPATAPIVSREAVGPQPAATQAGHLVSAPMAGTFYAASNPDAQPYVAVGDVVEAGSVLCIIESMKMMHEIKADAGGVVTEVCVANATPIASGTPLFRLA